jgi:AraC-like DNA-binding protein
MNGHSKWAETGPDDAMLITPDRIALSIATGFPATRLFGALTVYVSRNVPIHLTMEDGPTHVVEFAIVPPHTRHRAITADGHITKVLIETETIDIPGLMEYLDSDHKRRDAIAARMREAFQHFPNVLEDEVDVDNMFFGGPLPTRLVDPRFIKIIERIKQDSTVKLTAKECAGLAGLSFSRFIHLFPRETGATFRGFQAWRHARGFMPFVSGPYNLMDVALQIGYSDAPHFSRSIRQFYGITPKQISSVARKLRVVVQPPHAIDCRTHAD